MPENFSITSILTALGSVVSWIWGLFGDIFDIIKSIPLLFVLFGIPVVVMVIYGVIRLVNKFKRG